MSHLMFALFYVLFSLLKCNYGQQFNIMDSFHNCDMKKNNKCYLCFSLPHHAPFTYQSKIYPNPNPKKKYTLQYEDDRGWVIKPMSAAGNNNYACRTETVHVNSCQCPPKIKSKKTTKLDKPRISVQEKKKKNITRNRLKYICDCSHASPIQTKKKHKVQKENIVDEIPFNSNTRSLHVPIVENPSTLPLPPISKEATTITKHFSKSEPRLSMHRTHKATSMRGFTSKPMSKRTSMCYKRSASQQSKAVKVNSSHKCNIKKAQQFYLVSPYHRLYFPKKMQKTVMFDRNTVRNVKKNCKTSKEKKDKRRQPAFGKRLCYLSKSYGCDIKNAVSGVETAAWGNGIKCENLYMNTFIRRPCYWIYKCCPSVYPCFLDCHKFFVNIFHALMFVLTTCTRPT
ncbi:uncharacterized protein LOC128200303 [Galleria mellonella]|uniref:Uncharacterized protein LOC128200303 n=1 Tax=Galleria mellonella TaxID=7137 RepID=A0ABM3ME04_GALME|nr:uncharacterized protein LOC128200303 [Galleria mellonella]